MTTANNWKVNADGDWATAANWTLGTVPTSSNTVTISTTDIHTITHNSGSDIVSSLTVGADFFNMNGGSLYVLGAASFADGFYQYGGTLTVGGTLSVTGPLKLLAGGSEGATAFTVAGTATLAGYTLGGASTLKVNGTANETGQVALGDGSDVGAAITIAAAGAYQIAGDFGIGQGASSATFTNSGILRKAAGAGTSIVAVSTKSTGAIGAASGDLQFDGPSNLINGALTGAGQISFGGGVTALGVSTVSIATFGVYGAATVNLQANLTLSGVLADVSNGTDTINLGAHNLTLSGATAAMVGVNGVALVSGSGTLTNNSVLSLSNAVFGGTVKITNGKTIDQTSTVTLGDGSGGAPMITNLAAGTYDFTGNAALGQNGATTSFVNQGLLEQTGGGTSTISLAVTNSGTITAQTGTLNFNNSLLNTGTISGPGTVEVSAGVVTLNAGSVLSVATFDLYNSATVALGTSLTYAGVLNDFSNGTDFLSLGANTLTLSGASNSIVGANGVAVISGSAKLANSGTLTLGGAVIDGTLQIANTGTINQNANITIGGGGGQIALIANYAGANYNLAGAYTIGNGTAAASHFNNAGTVTVQGGTGSAVIATTFNNIAGGLINIASGALQNNSALINNGKIAGTRLILNSGQTTFAAGSNLTVGEIDLYNSSLMTIGANLTYAGTFIDASNGYTTVNLGANTLTLNGANDFSASNGTVTITGSGTLKLGHATNIEGGATVIGGTAHLSVASAVTATANLQIGDGSANAAAAAIAAGGVYDLTADAGVSGGASAASTFTNGGLFEKTAGGGTSVVSVKFVNTGTIKVTSGTLEFKAGTLTNTGSIVGTQTTDVNGNLFITAVSGASAKVSKGAASASPLVFAQTVASMGTSGAIAPQTGYGGQPANSANLFSAGQPNPHHA